MNKTFRFFCFYALAVLFAGVFMVSCGSDDEEVALKGMDFVANGRLTMAVEMTTPGGVQSVDCGTVDDKVTVKSTDDNSVAAITLGEFTTPPIVQHRNMVISITDIRLKGLKLTDKGGTYGVEQEFDNVVVDRCDFGTGQPMQNLAVSGVVSGVVSPSGSVNLRVKITKMGSMPYVLVLDFKN